MMFISSEKVKKIMLITKESMIFYHCKLGLTLDFTMVAVSSYPEQKFFPLGTCISPLTSPAAIQNLAFGQYNLHTKLYLRRICPQRHSA